MQKSNIFGLLDVWHSVSPPSATTMPLPAYACSRYSYG